MADDFLVGIDIGAGSLKTMIISSDGEVCGSASCEITTESPHAGWSEQDPHDWWEALCQTVPRAIALAGIDNRQIAAIGFSAGAHTPVLVDRTGKVLRPAILWSDSRSAEEANELQANFGDEILAIALNRPAPTWTQPQLLWLARHEPQVLSETSRLYVAKDWLRGRLTGTWETDQTEAAGTLLFDGRANEWSERLCRMVGFDISKLPPVVNPTSVVGTVTRRAAEETGLAEGTRIVCGSSDTSVEAYGTGATHPGRGTVKLATAAAISVVGESPRVDATLINYPFVVPGLWYTLGATNSCASAHRWLGNCFYQGPGDNPDAVFARMDAMAGEVAPGAAGLLFHPYLQGERSPHWDPLLRADFVGMTFAHDRRHFVRALYEGIAFSLRDVLEQLRAKKLELNEATIIGGGSKSALWRQIVADVLGLAISMPKVTDASYGAALIAGVGAGVFPNEVEAASRAVAITSRHEPNTGNAALYEEMYDIYRETASALTSVNHRLTRLQRAKRC
jgi:xylulokinase